MRRAVLALLLLVPVSAAAAQEPLILEGPVPEDAPPYFEVPFQVPAGTVELEIHHDDRSDANILDWGLRDPNGFRGWGGGNTEPIVVNAESASRSYRPGPIVAGEWAVLVGQALVTEAPAEYRIAITFRTETTLAPRARTPYTESPPLRDGPAWFAGDFHVHSRESGDAHPTLDEVASFARSRGLDFVELSEHNVVSQLDFIAETQAEHPDLLLIPGIEVTTYWGHANAIGATEWIDFRVMSGLDVSIDTIVEAIAAQGAVFSINHPVLNLGSACIGCAWDLPADPARVQAVELQNGAYSITGRLFYRDALQLWDDLLDEGSRAAAIGGSDDHGAGEGTGAFTSPIGSPTTMVYAEALSVEAITRALAEGRTVVKLEGPDDPMVELFAGDARIGDTITERSAELRAVVTGGEGGTLRFVRNGEPGPPIAVDADPFEATLAIEAPGGDVDDRFRAELRVGREPRVVTSHLWVRATGEPIGDAGVDADGGPSATPGGGGCGCRIGGGGSAPIGALASLVLVVFVRRRGAGQRDARASRSSTILSAMTLVGAFSLLARSAISKIVS